MTSTMPTVDNPTVPAARPAPEAGPLATVPPEVVATLTGPLVGLGALGDLDRVAVDLESSARAARWVLRLLLLGVAGITVVLLA